VVGDLHRGVADAAGGTQDEDLLAGLDVGAGLEHPPRGLEDEGGGAGNLPVNVRGDRDEVLGGDGREFGVDASNVLPNNNVERRAERFFTMSTELTLATGDAGAHGDVVAGLKPRHALADCLDDAGRVTAGNVGHLQVDSGHPATRPDVEVVQRARLNVDKDFAAVGLGIREIAVLDHVAVAVGVELDGLHARTHPRHPLNSTPNGSPCSFLVGPSFPIGENRRGLRSGRVTPPQSPVLS